MRELLGAVALSLTLAMGLFGQAASLMGTVADPTGAVIPKAVITLINMRTGLQRQDTSDAQGRYTMDQLPPGTYKLTATAPGFADVVLNIQLSVNQPVTAPVTFENVGTASATISVEAFTTQVNTQDATLGNAIGAPAIVELPSFARNVANLLQFQPGVTSFGGADDRNGAVNGGKSDQGNVTLDGVDVNNQFTRVAFTSVLRVTPDSVEEFRTITTNGDATKGRASGADIALITKSGTNQFHGALYEYRRGTETAANDFFNNRSGVPRPPLLINIFGGAAGGPIKKNKAFFFMNYEGRRDASALIVNRIVPTETMKQGIVQFRNAAGQLTQVGPAQIKTIDPLGVGVNPAAVKIFQAYPVGNNNSLGDQLNTIGYRFNAPVHSNQNTYIARLDYKLDESGRHSFFWRGNLQNDRQNSPPQFPGAQPNSVTLFNNKGYATGWTTVLTPSIVSSFRYGFTRLGGGVAGNGAANYVLFRGFDPIYGTVASFSRIMPVHTIAEDVSWSRGAHNLRFGAVARLISIRSAAYSLFSTRAITDVFALNGRGADLTPASLGVSNRDLTSYQFAIVALLGIVTSATANYNYLVDGSILPSGAPVKRNFVNTEGEMYAQDSWRIRRNLTVTYGARLSLAPPVHEADGQQISTGIPIGDWFNRRGGLADQGLSTRAAGDITYVLASQGRPLYPYHKNWAPRLSIAYSPNAAGGLSRFFFGGPGKTSFRAGAGMYFDQIGQPLAAQFDGNSFGLATTISTPSGVFDTTQLPRFTGFYDVPGQLVPAAPKGGFPATYPNSFAITASIDDKLKAPYTMNLSFSIGRQFGYGFFVQGSYVGRLSRHSLMQRDLAMPANLRDPQSGQTYFQAMSQLATLLDFQGVSVANLPKIPFFENLWTKAAGNGFSATQAVAKDYLERNSLGNFTTVLSDMDNGSNCGASGSTFDATTGRITRLACGNLGAFSMWSPQFSSLAAWSSLGKGSYHAMQWTIRKQFSDGLLFDLNYTFSKSIDLSSRSEASGTFNSDFMINSWDPSQLRAVSRYDVKHSVNSLLLYQLPFGRGRKHGRGMNKILDAFAGGWQITGTYRQTSGLPFTVTGGTRWPTNWNISAFATPNGNPIPQPVSAHNAPAVSGPSGPNLWTDPKAALAGFSYTLPGQTGIRNGLRGDGFFDIDSGLAKTFSMPWSENHQLQIRWESFNVTNSVRLDPASADVSLTSASFGKLAQQLGSPRQMQFALRYSF